MRLLESQKAELEKAVEETEKLVEQTLAEESPAEVKIRMDIEELTGKMGLLNCQLVKVRITALSDLKQMYIQEALASTQIKYTNKYAQKVTCSRF